MFSSTPSGIYLSSVGPLSLPFHGVFMGSQGKICKELIKTNLGACSEGKEKGVGYDLTAVSYLIG